MSAAPLLELPPLDAPSGREQAHEIIGRAEAAIDRAEYGSALEALAERSSAVAYPDLLLRGLFAESWALMYLGDLEQAERLVERARSLAERPSFGDVDRAESLYRLGCLRLKRSAVANAVSLFSVALDLCDRSGAPCDRLRANVLEWRARCYQLQRDWDAARGDVERALELAQSLGDGHTEAHVLFQASLVAERTGQWLIARCYAEQAKALYEHAGDRPNVGRLLNNLGGLLFLLGKPEEAVLHLEQALVVAAETGNGADVAQATSSLAQVHLRTGEPELAERDARRALELLGGRPDFVDELGNTQLVLGRALLEQGRHDEAARLFDEAEQSFDRLGSVSHRAAAWTAQGDLQAARGDAEAAAALFRRAAESLQDFHF